MAATKLQLASEIVERMPESPSRMLGRRLYQENKLLFPTENAAYLAVRTARGATGKATRKYATNKREAPKEPWAPQCPPSRAKSWDTFGVTGPCRVLILSDVHIPYHDHRALLSAVNYAKSEFDPDVLLLNGDFADFFSISRWEKDPRDRDLAGELDSVKKGLSWLRGKFPRARPIYKIGNHEERWDKYLWNKAPELLGVSNVTYDKILGLDEMGYELVADQRIIMVGQLPVYHGHEIPGLSSPVNAARGVYLKTAHSGLIGHLHRSSTNHETDVFHNRMVCWSTGCLCDLRPEYARINRWNHGFAVVDVDKAGEYRVHNFGISKEGDVRNV